jgi:D-sedoheptulose 7-phosphate isomerase
MKANYYNKSQTALNIAELTTVLQSLDCCFNEIEFGFAAISSALSMGAKIMTAGNGGSAVDALHLAEELIGKFEQERLAYPAICISADSTVITCIGNDYGFDQVFSRQVQGLGRNGDVLVVFSTSGESKNICNALVQARDSGVKTIALLGKSGGKARSLSDIAIVVPSESTARIQEVHTLVLHTWLAMLEEVR